WSADISHLKNRLYQPILGISFKGVELKSLDSIIFHIGVDIPNFRSHPYFEIITKQQLKKMCRWKLHRQFDIKRYTTKHPLLVKMEIIRSACPPHEPTQEYLELHYFELHSSPAEYYDVDAPLIDHMPFLWSINIEHKEAPADVGPVTFVDIIHYAISGDCKYAVTLSVMDNNLYLELWDLSYTTRNSFPVTNVKDPSIRPPSVWSERISLPLPKLDKSGNPVPVNAAVSISWSGAYVALFPTTKDSRMEHSVIYKSLTSPCPELLKENLDSRTPMIGLQRWEGPNFYGKGMFHITDVVNPQERNELFITCDGASVQIYKVHEAWSRICTVPLGADPLLSTKDCTISLGGKYFTWFRGEGQAFIWNIEADALANVITGGKGKGACLAEFSSDGLMVAISWDNTITTYWTESGTEIGNYQLPIKTHASGLTFIRNDSRILVDWISQREESEEAFGYILSTATMSQLDKFPNLGRYSNGIGCSKVGQQGLYSCHGSTLNLIELEDYMFDPISPTTCICNEDNWNDYSVLPALSKNQAFIASSGLSFIPMFNESSDCPGDTHSVSLIVSYHGSERELIRLPPFTLDKYDSFNCYYKSAHYRSSLSQLLLYSDEIIVIFSLPETFDGDCNIVQVYWLQDDIFRGNKVPIQLKEELDLQCCKHQKQLLMTLHPKDSPEELIHIQVPLDRPDDEMQGFRFINAIMALVEIYKAAETSCRQAIIRYLGFHINTYFNSGNLLECVIGVIIEAWKPEDHEICAELLDSLLTSEKIRWIPRPDYTQTDNPLYVLLKQSRQTPLAMGLANIIIQYCLRKGKEEKDYHFMSPLVSCLPELCDDSNAHQEIALDILRTMAYVPVKLSSYSYILDNHIIAHPPEIRWFFWRSHERPLSKCDDPILQLCLSSKPHGSQRDNFVKGIFVAPIGMLWDVNYKASTVELDEIRFYSWIGKMRFMSLASLIWYHFNPRRRAYVKRYSSFNSNTIGYQYWLGRFLLQCVYYLLVLIAVYVQIYWEQEPIYLLYFVIILFSAIFLWLEALQFFRNQLQYIMSPYNVVDMAVFALPLAASIKQIASDPGVRDVHEALINTAFSTGDETWPQVWLENRLSYIENAENMLCHLEGVRQRNKRLPKLLYFTATPQQRE
ncbi:hypothetical protein BGZ94_000245, partial [Podila epigama]